MVSIESRNAKIFGGAIIFLSILGFLFYDNWQELENAADNPDNQSIVDEQFLGITVFGSGVLFTPENFTQDGLNALLTDTWYVRIFGNVRLEVYIGLSYLINGNNFTYISNENYEILNQWGTTYNRRYHGVALDDIFQKTGCLKANSTRFYFRAMDGFRSFDCTISIVMNNPSQFLLGHMEQGEVLKTKEEGGEGPIKGVAPLSPLQNDPEIIQIYADNGQNVVYNSQYFVKYLNQIYII